MTKGNSNFINELASIDLNQVSSNLAASSSICLDDAIMMTTLFVPIFIIIVSYMSSTPDRYFLQR